MFPQRRERNKRRVVKFDSKGEAVQAFTAMAEQKTLRDAGSARWRQESNAERGEVHAEALRLNSAKTHSEDRPGMLADRKERYKMAAKNVQKKQDSSR